MKRNEELFERLLTIVPKGRENAIPQWYLASLLNLSVPQVKSLLCQARTEGYFIAGDLEGYYVPVTLDELHSYYRYMYQGAMTRLRSLEAFRKTLKSYGINNPEKDFPEGKDKHVEVPSKNVRHDESKRFQQTCFVFFFDDLEE